MGFLHQGLAHPHASLETSSKPRNWTRAGIGSGGVGPGWVAQVASPGSMKQLEKLSLMFIKSYDITHIFQKCCEPQDLCHPQASILLRNFQPYIFNYPFSSKLRSLALILHRSSLPGNILHQGLEMSQASTRSVDMKIGVVGELLSSMY